MEHSIDLPTSAVLCSERLWNMLDLQRHENCPIWRDVLSNPSIPWTGLQYTCLKVLQAYCKVFEQQELYDLIVRYFQNYTTNLNITNNNEKYSSCVVLYGNFLQRNICVVSGMIWKLRLYFYLLLKNVFNMFYKNRVNSIKSELFSQKSKSRKYTRIQECQNLKWQILEWSKS